MPSDNNELESLGNFKYLLQSYVIDKILDFLTRNDLLNMRSINKGWSAYIKERFKFSYEPLHYRLGARDLDYTHYPKIDSEENAFLKKLISYVKKEEILDSTEFLPIFEKIGVKKTPEEGLRKIKEKIKNFLETSSPMTLVYFSIFVLNLKNSHVKFYIASYLAAEATLMKTQSVTALILMDKTKKILGEKFFLEEKTSKEKRKIENSVRRNVTEYFENQVGCSLKTINDMLSFLEKLWFSTTYEIKIKNIKFFLKKNYKNTTDSLLKNDIFGTEKGEVFKKIDVEKQFIEVENFSEFLLYTESIPHTIIFLSKNPSFTMRDWRIETIKSGTLIEKLKMVEDVIWDHGAYLHLLLENIGEFKDANTIVISDGIFEKIKRINNNYVDWSLKKGFHTKESTLRVLLSYEFARIFPVVYLEECYNEIVAQANNELNFCEGFVKKLSEFVDKIKVSYECKIYRGKAISKYGFFLEVMEFVGILSEWLSLSDVKKLLSGEFETPKFVEDIRNQLLTLNISSMNMPIVINGNLLRDFSFLMEHEEKDASLKVEELIIFFAVIDNAFTFKNSGNKFSLLSLYRIFVVFQKNSALDYFVKILVSFFSASYKQILVECTNSKGNFVPESLKEVIHIFYEERSHREKIDQALIQCVGINGVIRLHEKGLLKYLVGRIIANGYDYWEKKFLKEGFSAVCSELTKEIREKPEEEKTYDIFPSRKYFLEKFKDNSLSVFVRLSNIKASIETGLEKKTFNLFDVVKGNFFWSKITECINYPVIESQIKQLINIAWIISLCPENYREELLEQYPFTQLIEKHSICFAEEKALFRPSLLQLFCYQQTNSILDKLEGKSEKEVYEILYQNSIYVLAEDAINFDATIYDPSESENESPQLECINYTAPTSMSKRLLENNGSTANETNSESKCKKQKIETPIIQENNDEINAEIFQESLKLKHG